MKWEKKKLPRYEIVTKFLFFKKTLRNKNGFLETRWLCKAAWKRENYPLDYCYYTTDIRWACTDEIAKARKLGIWE